MIRQEITNLIKKATKEARLGEPEFSVEHPEDKTRGEYAVNIALKLAKNLKMPPMEIAENLRSHILRLKTDLFDKVEIAEPGFINFFISNVYLQKQVGEILKQKDLFSQLEVGKNKKVQVEFISANPTGPLTVGNARGGPLGDVLGNVLKKAGFKVEKAYYINDYGAQILALGHSVLKDERAVYKGDYINYLHERIKEKEPYRVGEEAAKIILEEMIKKTTDRMGINYDEWFSETSLHKSNTVDKALGILKKKGLIYKKEGAEFFRSTKYEDIRDRVVVKADVRKTYLAGDIAYHRYKFEKKKFDKVINLWGADHAGDALGLQGAMEALGHKGKLDIIFLQFVTLLEKGKKLKISKRKGIYVSMDEVLDAVGPDVARFFFLQKSADTHLNFDFSLAKEQSQKNPVYYVQYAHARICSILKKLKIKNENFKTTIKNLKLLNHPSELSLIKELIISPEVIEDTAEDYQAQRLPQYALDLATAFHQFYRDCKVLSEVEGLQRARLSLVRAAQIVLKNTLSLMGISAPEKM